jgi:hypothetical protein
MAAPANTQNSVNGVVTPPSGWKTWTPTIGGSGWALGNGQLIARYLQNGNTVHWMIRIQFGSTSTFGADQLTFTLPVAAQSASFWPVGSGNAGALKQGLSYYTLGLQYLSTTGVGLWVVGTSGASTSLTATAPVTWASTDIIFLGGTYEAAAAA